MTNRTPHSTHTERSVSNCIGCHSEDQAELDAKEKRESVHKTVLSEAEMTVRRWLARVYYERPVILASDLEREMCITPYEGENSGTAGYVIALRGSPPKGTLYVPWNGWSVKGAQGPSKAIGEGNGTRMYRDADLLRAIHDVLEERGLLKK